MKLSIIVPVYNVEQYLGKCIESIVNQKMTDFECILVDDGSTDNSGTICDLWSKRDSKIRTFHKENGGLMDAWKYGVTRCHGDYVGFVDSDDWIDPDMFSEMYEKAITNNCDIVCSAWIKEFEDGSSEKEIIRLGEGVYTRENIVQEILPNILYNKNTCSRGISPNRVTKIFKKSLVESVMAYCDDDVSIGEDLLTTFSSLQKANRIYIFNEYYPYHYRINSNSMTVTFTPEKYKKLHKLYKALNEASKIVNYDFAEQINLDYISLVFLHMEDEILCHNIDYFACKRDILGVYNSDVFMNSLKAISKHDLSKKIKLYLFLLKKHMFFLMYAIRRLKR